MKTDNSFKPTPSWGGVIQVLIHPAMQSRRDYEKTLGIVGAMIRAWDSYSLIAEGAPAYEFENQIAKITARLASMRATRSLWQSLMCSRYRLAQAA